MSLWIVWSLKVFTFNEGTDSLRFHKKYHRRWTKIVWPERESFNFAPNYFFKSSQEEDVPFVSLYLYNWGHHSGWGNLDLSSSCHIGNSAEMVHLVHRHGDRGRRQADRNQGMWHHHEWQFQTWTESLYMETNIKKKGYFTPKCKFLSLITHLRVVPHL